MNAVCTIARPPKDGSAWQRRALGFLDTHRFDLLAVLFLFLISFISTLIMFKPGFYNGHDTVFHANQVWSYYQSLKRGDIAGWISPSLAGDFGISVRSLYSSLAHTVTAVCYLFLEPLGFTLTTAFKFVHFLTIFFSGVFAYAFGKKLFNNSVVFALLIAVAFALNPYRLTLIYVRNAYAENFAYQFIPLFFLALHQIVRSADKNAGDLSFSPYATLMISTGLLLLSHNITALYSVFFGVFYLVFSLKPRRIARLLSAPRFYIYSGFAVVGALLIYTPILVPLFVYTNADLNLRIFKDVMGANYEAVIKSIETSGVYFTYSISSSKLPVVAIVAAATAAVVGTVRALVKDRQRQELSDIVYFAGLLTASLCYAFIGDRAVGGAVLFFAVGTVLWVILRYDSFLSCDKKWPRIELQEGFAFIILTLINVVLMLSETAWKFLPSIFYRIQFTFRLWTFLYFFAFVAVLIFLYKLGEKRRELRLIAPMLIISLTAVSNYTNTGTLSEYGMDRAVENYDHNSTAAMGWQYEYLTDYFFSDSDYQNLPSYYRNVVATMLFWVQDRYEKPIQPNIGDRVYEESLKFVKNYTYNSTDGAKFDVVGIHESTYIIMPLFYYPGYEIKFTSLDGVVERITPRNVKGLLNFDIEQDGHFEVRYIGTQAMRDSNVVFITLSLTGVMLAIGGYAFKRKKRYEVLE